MTALAVAASSLPNAITVGREDRGEGVAGGVVLRGDAHQAVLDDPVLHVLLAEGAADLGDLLHLRPRYSERSASGCRCSSAQLERSSAPGLGRHGSFLTSVLGARPARRWPHPASGKVRPCAAPAVWMCRGAAHRAMSAGLCLGVLAVVPGVVPRGMAAGPVRTVDPASTLLRVRLPRAQAVCGDPYSCCRPRRSARLPMVARPPAPIGRGRGGRPGMSTRMPGPWSLATVSVLRYWPLAPPASRGSPRPRERRGSGPAGPASKCALPTGRG